MWIGTDGDGWFGRGEMKMLRKRKPKGQKNKEEVETVSNLLSAMEMMRVKQGLA